MKSTNEKSFCGECGPTDSPIVRQCLECGCAVCEKCYEIHDGGPEDDNDDEKLKIKN